MLEGTHVPRRNHASMYSQSNNFINPLITRQTGLNIGWQPLRMSYMLHSKKRGHTVFCFLYSFRNDTHFVDVRAHEKIGKI